MLTQWTKNQRRLVLVQAFRQLHLTPSQDALRQHLKFIRAFQKEFVYENGAPCRDYIFRDIWFGLIITAVHQDN